MNRASLVPAILAIIAFLVLAVAFGSGVFASVERAVALVPAGFALIMIAVVAGSVVLARRHAVSRSALALDAISRGFGFTPELRGWGLPGILFRAAHTVVTTDLIDARATATPFIAGSIATDAAEAGPLHASFVAIPLERAVPDLVLLSTGFSVMTTAGVVVDHAERMTLGDELDARLTLHCAPEDEVEARRMLTPELLRLLLQMTGECDVEIVDGWMFVYSRAGSYAVPRALDGIVALTTCVQAAQRTQPTS